MSPKKSAKRSTVIIGGIIAAVALALFGYLMWVCCTGRSNRKCKKLIAITNEGCVVETRDGFAITIPSCEGEPGDTIVVTYDPKIKERAAAMNPTN